MIKIAVCDDDIREQKQIVSLLDKYAEANERIDLSVSCFTSSLDLAEQLNETDGYSVYILDILMPSIDGIELGERIRQKDDSAFILYLTAYPDYAVRAFSVYAYQYLMKPVTSDILFPVLNKIVQALADLNSRSIAVKTADGLYALRLHLICYAEYQNHRVHYHLTDGTVIKSVTLRQSFDVILEPLLRDNRFVKITASYLINLNCVTAFNKRNLVLSDGTCLPVSRKLYTRVKQNYLDFLLGENKVTADLPGQ
ncbi:LytTR family DNA-binding domain-containing protein [Anaerolentibacter hominis]|uniref:LytR/AlgR family response regulator transcription factor n=1 Tax=Anaerolentibacter hominis TaxID=3079009 RepID=UPI0031B8906B